MLHQQKRIIFNNNVSLLTALLDSPSPPSSYPCTGGGGDICSCIIYVLYVHWYTVQSPNFYRNRPGAKPIRLGLIGYPQPGSEKRLLVSLRPVFQILTSSYLFKMPIQFCIQPETCISFLICCTDTHTLFNFEQTMPSTHNF